MKIMLKAVIWFVENLTSVKYKAAIKPGYRAMCQSFQSTPGHPITQLLFNKLQQQKKVSKTPVITYLFLWCACGSWECISDYIFLILVTSFLTQNWHNASSQLPTIIYPTFY